MLIVLGARGKDSVVGLVDCGGFVDWGKDLVSGLVGFWDCEVCCLWFLEVVVL